MPYMGTGPTYNVDVDDIKDAQINANANIAYTKLYQVMDLVTAQTASGNKSFGGDTDFINNPVMRPALRHYSEYVTTFDSSLGDEVNLDLSASSVFVIDLNLVTGSDLKIKFENTNIEDNKAYALTVVLYQASSPKTVTWFGSPTEADPEVGTQVFWANQSPPTLSQTSSNIDIFTMITYDAGNDWFGFVAGQNMA